MSIRFITASSAAIVVLVFRVAARSEPVRPLRKPQPQPAAESEPRFRILDAELSPSSCWIPRPAGRGCSSAGTASRAGAR